jgi:hypothetical protein
MKPIIWNEIFSDRLFWAGFHSQEDEIFDYYEMWLRYLDIYREDETGNDELNIEDLPNDIKLCVPFPEQFALQWNIYNSNQIQLIHPDNNEPIVLGWVDGHFHNVVFRISEFESIVKCAEKHWMGSFDIKYFPLLFYKYSWVTNESELIALQSRFTNDWRSLEVFTEKDLETFSSIFLQIYPYKWINTEEYGWLCEGDYSLRDIKLGSREVSNALKDFFSVVDSYAE